MEVCVDSLSLWWCRLFHGRGRKSFAIPKPHPRGQEFLVRCQVCHRVYPVITPVGWISPWRANAAIAHQDREDPVQEYQGNWWYMNSRTLMREGPYPTEREARDAYTLQFADNASARVIKQRGDSRA
jgi:hypothetical protein